MSDEILNYERDQYLDCQRIIDKLLAAGISADHVDRLIALRNARAHNDLILMLSEIKDSLREIVRRRSA